MNRAANDFAQHIAAAFVRRNHAIGDQERCRASMIGNDSQRSGAAAIHLQASSFLQSHATKLRSALSERNKQIRVVVADDAFEDRGHAFQAHAGVYRRFRQGIEVAAMRRD